MIIRSDNPIVNVINNNKGFKTFGEIMVAVASHKTAKIEKWRMSCDMPNVDIEIHVNPDWSDKFEMKPIQCKYMMDGEMQDVELQSLVSSVIDPFEFPNGTELKDNEMFMEMIKAHVEYLKQFSIFFDEIVDIECPFVNENAMGEFCSALRIFLDFDYVRGMGH